MIFVAVGTQKFQFNRLLEEIDTLVKKGVITESVIVQNGHSAFHSSHCDTVDFMSNEEFQKTISDCRILITHAGIGTIIKGLEKQKKIIVVPRQKAFHEHVDEHQNEIAQKFEAMGYVRVCRNMEELEACYRSIDNFSPKAFQLHYSNTVDFINNQLAKISQNQV